jgi:hypothetical protein
MKKKFDSKYYTHLSPHDKWVLKSLISTVEMLDKVVVEITNVRKENDKRLDKMARYIEGMESDVRFLRHYLGLKKTDKFKSITELKNPKIEDMFNMKRGDPFKEGTD